MYLTKLIGFGITSYSHLFFREETVDISHKRSFDVLEYGGKVLRLQKNIYRVSKITVLNVKLLSIA